MKPIMPLHWRWQRWDKELCQHKRQRCKAQKKTNRLKLTLCHGNLNAIIFKWKNAILCVPIFRKGLRYCHSLTQKRARACSHTEETAQNPTAAKTVTVIQSYLMYYNHFNISFLLSVQERSTRTDIPYLHTYSTHTPHTSRCCSRAPRNSTTTLREIAFYWATAAIVFATRRTESWH